jgi:hypothetical protein
MSVLQNRLYHKDIPGNLGADVTVTNAGTHEVVTPLGSVIPPNGGQVVLTAYEWAEISGPKRTEWSLTAV